MDLYFFLDSGIFSAAITVTPFPPSGDINSNKKKDIFICFAYPDRSQWRIKTYKKMNCYEQESIFGSDLGLNRDALKNTIVFLSPLYLDGSFDCLPEFNEFESVPAWRANLKIIGKGTSVSYQGEYPYQMTKIRGGSIVSFVPFIQKSTTIKNYLFYVSFSSHVETKRGVVEFKNLKTMKKISEFDVVSNSVNFIDLNSIVFEDGQIMITGSGIMGVPVFFSTDENGKKMSLEHTMTPSEYSIFCEPEVRRSIMQNMKTYWSKV